MADNDETGKSQNLIPLSQEKIGGETVETVDARKLHIFLEVTSKFADWIKKRIQDFGFIENVDFVTFSENLESGGKRKEYALSLDMAKEISMVERNDRGRQARQYFIACEKRLRSSMLAPVISPPKEARLTHQYGLKLAAMMGLKSNQAVLSANNLTKAQTGVDFMERMGIKAIEAPVNEADLNPSSIGKRLDGISAQKVNAMLLEYGYQDAHRDHKGRIYYEPTSKGFEAGAVFKDTGKRQPNGTPIKQLFWSARIIDSLRTAMLAETDA